MTEDKNFNWGLNCLSSNKSSLPNCIENNNTEIIDIRNN